ncbi:MAG: hypothetical protein ACKOCQ_02095 [Candidatus Nitrosotenuis sp.]
MIYSVDPDQAINKALLAFSIESALVRVGGPYYDKVISRLEKEYGLHISDCDKNPQALKQILQDIFGKSYQQILNEIKLELNGASSKEYYSNFLTALAK